MNFLPVLGRELRVTSRSSRLYWGRFTAALFAMGLVMWFWGTLGTTGNSAQKAQQIFGTLATFAFVYGLGLGGYVTSDSISEERREGTLGLLFLTNLRSYDVVIGKAAAGSLRAFFTLVAIFPVLTIPILLGGLSGGMIFRMTLVLMNTLFFSLCVGLLISACSRHDRKAQAGVLLSILVITVGLPLLFSLIKYELKWNISENWFAISPVTAFVNAFDQPYAARGDLFWNALVIPHALGWFAFGAASAIVGWSWRDRVADAGGASRWQRFKQWTRGSAEKRADYRRRLLNINPYFWLAGRDRRKPAYVALFLGLCAVCWLLLWWKNPRDMLEHEAFFITAIILHIALKYWIATEAGRQLYDDRRNSGLELTLSTPLPVKEILEGQFLALVRQFGWAIGAVVLFDLAGLIVGSRRQMYGAETAWVLGWVAIIIVLLVDGATIATVGMWLGLTAKRSSRAVVQTIGYVLFLPWVVLIGVMTYMMITRFSRVDSVNFFIGTYFVISIVTDLVLFLWASGNLTQRFREVAVQRFDSVRAG